MVINRLQESLNALLKYMELSNAPDLNLALFSPVKLADDTTRDVQSSILQSLYSIMSVNEGGHTSNMITQRLADIVAGNPAAENDVKKKISVFVDKNVFDPNMTMSNIVGSCEGLSVIQIDTIRITPAGRNTTAVAALLNMIPTIELSRCVPYLSINVQTSRPPISSDGRVQGLNIPKFLEGNFTAASQGDRLIMSSFGGDALSTEDGGAFSGGKTIAGMELFTSPQTLVNPNSTSKYVIDKFRPMLSIDKLNVEITPQVGFFAYRTADLDLTLHDRSRLSEIADFIKPDLYGTTELIIDYGWSHPDRTGENAYGALLNAMRVHEKYGIVNSSFSLTKSGEVKIKLKLFTRGMSDMQTIRLGESGEAVDALRAIRNLQKAYAAIKANLLLEKEGGNKEIRGEQQLFSSSDDIGTSLVLSAESRDLVRKFLSRSAKTTNPDLKALANTLKDLYGVDGKGSQKIVDLNKSVSATISKQLKDFRTADEKSDPFLASLQKKREQNPGLRDQSTTFLKLKSEYVSFGRLMSSFIGKSLANKEKYVDVQLIFYPFNAKAGACANYNIAEFPIKLTELENGLMAIARSRGLQLTLKEFLQYIANNFIDDISNDAYGLSNYYVATLDPKTGVRSAPNKRQEKLDETKLFDLVQARLLKVGSQDGTFKPPQIDIILETVPVAAKNPGEDSKISKLQTILKVHFFDKCSTAYESISALILASREEDLRTIGNMANNVASDHAAVSNEMINKAKRLGIAKTAAETETQLKSTLSKINAQTSEPNNVYEVTFDIEKLRAFIRQNVPTLVYGSNNTGIKDASFSTIQNPLLSTVHMLRSGDDSSITPSSVTKANLPLRTLPAKVSMSTIGCPLIEYMQQFFIDFNTNTTIDNIYGVNKLTHEISPGRFESKIEFVPLDAYGRYESLPSQVGTMLQQLENIQKKLQQ